ncbi:MAG: hypothetical protein U0694_06880 [Anaerolineae bacterium]
MMGLKDRRGNHDLQQVKSGGGAVVDNVDGRGERGEQRHPASSR